MARGRIAIVTERLRLRRLSTHDLGAIAKLGADPRVMAVFGGAVSWPRAIHAGRTSSTA